MSYGVLKDGQIEDSNWFWDEVRLRAMNNYGAWKNKNEAIVKTTYAIRDIFSDNKFNVVPNEFSLTHEPDFDNIVKDMIESF